MNRRQRGCSRQQVAVARPFHAGQKDQPGHQKTALGSQTATGTGRVLCLARPISVIEDR